MKLLALAVSLTIGCGGGEAGPEALPHDSAENPGSPQGAPSPADAGPDPASTVATIRVHYPVKTRTLLLRGETAPLTSAGTPTKNVADDTWALSLGRIDKPVAFVPVLDDKPARGPAYSVSPGQTLDLYPHFDKDVGTISALPSFTSKILGNSRGLRVYLPPGYQENTAARYPVVYMHDGQVIFDGNLGALDGPAKSTFGSWRAEKVVDQGIEDGSLPEMIIVGIDIIVKVDPFNLVGNLTEVREQELTPTNVETVRKGSGKGPQYLQMIIDEIKPMIDTKYRTMADADHTMVAGSSLGGLMSIWAGIDHGDVFGRVLAMSSSTWWDQEVATKRVVAEHGGAHRALKIYTDTGDDESGQSSAEADAADQLQVGQTERLWKAYRDAGYTAGQTLQTRLDSGGQHNGQFWSARLGPALKFLLGAGR